MHNPIVGFAPAGAKLPVAILSLCSLLCFGAAAVVWVDDFPGIGGGGGIQEGKGYTRKDIIFNQRKIHRLSVKWLV